MKPRLHLIGLPHTTTTDDITVCAYTARGTKFCRMMDDWEITLYWGDRNDAPVTDQQRRRPFGESAANKFLGNQRLDGQHFRGRANPHSVRRKQGLSVDSDRNNARHPDHAAAAAAHQLRHDFCCWFYRRRCLIQQCCDAGVAPTHRRVGKPAHLDDRHLHNMDGMDTRCFARTSRAINARAKKGLLAHKSSRLRPQPCTRPPAARRSTSCMSRTHPQAP